MYSSPNWAEILTAVATSTVALSGVLALILAWKELRQNHKQNQVQHLLDFDQRYSSEPLLTYRRLLAEKRLRHEEEPDELYNLLDFFETVGLLVVSGYLDEYAVWSTFSYPIIIISTDFAHVLRDLSQEDPTTYSDFKLLTERMRLVEQQQGGTSHSPSPSDIDEYWTDEKQEPGHLLPKKTRAKRRKKDQPETDRQNFPTGSPN